MIRRILNLLPVLAMLAVAAMAQLPTPIASTVTVNTNGVVIAPANFWQANSNLMTVAATPARGAVTNIAWNAGHFSVSGTNVSLASTWLLTNDWLVDLQITNSVEFDDALRIDMDGLDTAVGGVQSLYLDGGVTTLRGVTNLQLVTPYVRLGNAISNHVLTLIDEVEGTVEFRAPTAGAVNLFSGWAPVTSPGGVQNDWEPWADALTAPIVGARLVGGLTITGLQPGDAVGHTFFLYVDDGFLQVRFDDPASTVQIRSSRHQTVSPAPTFQESSDYPANSAVVHPGQTAVFVFDTDHWIMMGVLGNSVVRISPGPQILSITSGGLVSPVISDGVITSASIAELRGISSVVQGPSSTQYGWCRMNLINDTGASVNIRHQFASTSATLRITTPTSADVTWPVGTEARFLRDPVTSRWRLLNASF